MHATIRGYEGIDVTRINDVAGKVNDTLVPKLRELPGFSGYYLIEGSSGVLSWLALFETSEETHQSTILVSKWITDEKLDSAPNPPKVTSGKVIAHSDRVLAVA